VIQLPVNISHKRREKASVKTAVKLLKNKGYIIEETGVKVERNGMEIGEIDILAKDKEGNCIAVEVKSGYADITAVRQAYVNAKITGCKPLIVARSYSNKDVFELAEELGVDILFLDDMFTVDPIELKVFIDESMDSLLISHMDLENCITQLDSESEYYLRLLAGGMGKDSYRYIEKLVEKQPCLEKFLKDKRTSSVISRYILRKAIARM
jgi:predicted RecB family endonuclease